MELQLSMVMGVVSFIKFLLLFLQMTYLYVWSTKNKHILEKWKTDFKDRKCHA